MLTTNYIICGGYGKKLSEFWNFITYDAYKQKYLRRRIIEFRRMWLVLGVEVTIKFDFEYKLFYMISYENKIYTKVLQLAEI